MVDSMDPPQRRDGMHRAMGPIRHEAVGDDENDQGDCPWPCESPGEASPDRMSSDRGTNLDHWQQRVEDEHQRAKAKIGHQASVAAGFSDPTAPSGGELHPG